MRLTNNVDYRDSFEQITGNSPYGFQERLGELLLSGQSVVFRAPTGSGKTWGTVAPFAHAMRTGKPLADRLLYALPLRIGRGGMGRRDHLG
ncbi:MAG: hypothetical protein JNK87_10185 [Bryobacterales bacterium]|nr:hypothetical protein [Bryobacterales bacterium]